MIDIKSLINGYDPSPNPRKFRDDSAKITDLNATKKGESRYKIIATEVLDGLYGIAEDYNDAVRAKAKAYAENKYHADVDDDDELYRKAKEHVDEVYAGKEDTLAAKRDATTNDLSAQKDEVGADRAAALRDLAKNYTKAESGLLEDLSRKGMMHSSVGDLSRESLLADHKEAIKRTENAYDRKVAVLDRKIEQANTAYETALNNYEISYAIKLENKLNRLKTERDRAEQAYEKEHSEQKQKAYDYYLVRNESENKEYEKAHADYKGDKKENYQARYDYLLNALSRYDKQSVGLFLDENADVLKQYLGLYYDRFIREVS